MTDIVYVDTNPYLDLKLDRRDKYRNLGELAFEMLKRGRDCNFKLACSDWVIHEFSKYVVKEELLEELEKFKQKNKLIIVYKTLEDWNIAKSLSKNHPDDALHYILAKKSGAKILCTRNWRDYDFITAESKILVLDPEAI